MIENIDFNTTTTTSDFLMVGLFEDKNENSLLNEELFEKKSNNSKELSTYNSQFIEIDYTHSSNINEDYNSSENATNQKREEFLNNNLTPVLLSLFRDESFEFGYASDSEKLISEQLKINKLATKNWINEIFIKNFHDEIIIIGILRILGRFDIKIMSPQAQTIALASLTHKNDEIKELGIRFFEKWISVDSLRILKNLSLDTIWLEEYLNQVIIDIEKELCHT